MKVYLTNLGKYNEGELVGKWVELPIDEDELEEHLESIGVAPETEYEEFFITDVDNEEGYPIKVEEYSNILEISEAVEALEELNDTELEIVTLLVDSKGMDIYEAIDDYKRGNVSVIYLNYGNSKSDLAQAFIDQAYGSPSELSKDTLESYFDYEAYGRDLAMEYTIGDNIAISDY